MIYFNMPFLRFFILAFCALCISYTGVQATHIKAGEIKSQRLSPTALTYRFTLYLYTKDASDIPQDNATLDFGDLSNLTVSRQSKTSIGNGTSVNIFVFDHTYKAISFYKVGFTEKNRNGGILNMSNSSQTAFYVELGFLIDPMLGLNNSPVLSVPPIDEGAVGKIYTHNPGAYDPDGDSISFRFVTPQSSAGINVLDYRLPGNPFFGGTATTGGPSFLSLNPVTGDIVWNTPSAYGIDPRLYNIAIMVEEWRLGVRIGYVIRDMQIEIIESTNNPPVLRIPQDTCIVAGTLLQEQISSTDVDGDLMFMEAYSGLFTLANSPATFNVVSNNTSFPIGNLRWQTNCAHVREQPYEVVFKVTDNSPITPVLTDIRSQLIYVKAPKPQNLVATPLTTSIQLTWNAYACSQASSIKIYRKECGVANFSPDPCDDGIPASSGYLLIAQVGAGTTTYSDDNNGKGLSQGIIYCYAIVASFPLPGNGVSYPSDEACTQLKIDVPVIASASVLSTSLTSGQIEVHWFTPLESPLPLPYEYEVWRATSDAPAAYALVTTLTAPPAPVDTFFTDSGLNTEQKQYFYKTRIVGAANFSPVQSSILFSTTPGNNSVSLSWNVTKASQVDTVEVYRSINGAAFTLIQTLKNKNKVDVFLDNNVQNCDTVCYYILIKASYCDPRLTGLMYSLSPTRCAIPMDDTPPKAPALKVMSCSNQPNLNVNVLTWNSLANKKCNTIKGYNIYYAPYANQSLSFLTFVKDTSFVHNKVDSSLAGCYSVTAVNYRDVLGAPSTNICVDNCVYYKFPNLITRNKDNLNDVFKAFPIPLGVEKVILNVYNVWGDQVYRFEGSPFFEWKGSTNAEKELSEGVYYYEINVNYYRRLNPDDENQIMKGWIHILGTE